MKKILAHLLCAAASILAAFCLATIALDRNEQINSFWLVVASACTYLVGFRFYARFLSTRVMALDDRRATPAEALRDGHAIQRRTRLRAPQQVDRLRTSFRRHRRTRPSGRTYAGRAVRLSAWNALDHH